MAGETNDELARRIEHLHTDLHDDLGRIEVQLARLVPREVYDAHRVADAARSTALEKRVEALEGRGRWLVASVIMPIISIVVMVWLSAGGVKP